MSTTEQHLLDLAWSRQVAMCLIDLNSQILQANTAFLDLVGATEEDVQTGLSLHEFLNLPQRRQGDEQESQQLQIGRWTVIFERELLRRDGSRLSVLVDFSSLEGVSDRYVAKMVNLVEHQHAQRDALHTAAMIDSSDDAIIGKDLDGIIVSWNSGAQQLYGYRTQEVVGQPISLLIPPELSDDLPGILSRLQRGERITHYETVRMTKDGRRVAVSVTISPIRESSGAIIGASSIARDITDRKQMEDMIRRQRDELMTVNSALEANRVRSKFLSTMSHELRTPLASIIGFSQLLLSDPAESDWNQQQQSNLERILKNGQHLLGLVNDVLDLEKIGTGRMQVLSSQVKVVSCKLKVSHQP